MNHTSSEAIREGLRLASLRKEIALGTAQLERGEATCYASGKEIAEKTKAEGRMRLANHKTDET